MLISAVDEFLATNPTSERGDQAKLLKAEALYKQQNCAEAVPLYEELRASQLSAKLRAEAGTNWAYVTRRQKTFLA